MPDAPMHGGGVEPGRHHGQIHQLDPCLPWLPPSLLSLPPLWTLEPGRCSSIYSGARTRTQLQTPDRKATSPPHTNQTRRNQQVRAKRSATTSRLQLASASVPLIGFVSSACRRSGHGVEGQLPGPGADPAQPAPPHGVPRLAVARGPPPPAPHRRRHQRRHAPPVGRRHDEGQREERGDRGAVGPERDHGVDADGDDGDPLLHGHRGGAEQHLHGEEAAERHRLRGARRVHDGAQVRGAAARLPPRLSMPLPRHLLPQPGHLPHQHLRLPRRRRRLDVRLLRRGLPGRPAVRQGLHRRGPGARLHPQPRRQPALLRRGAPPALDLRPAPRLPVVAGHDPRPLQPRRRGPQGPQRQRQREIRRDGQRQRVHARRLKPAGRSSTRSCIIEAIGT